PRPVAPPHLPSFPTRRSSDLRPRLDPGGLLPRGGLRVTLSKVRPGLVETAVGAAILLAVAAPAPAGARPSGTGACKPLPSTRLGDRKSTRLNSSHVSISYAVF